ncbi:hypothetical protein Tco_0571068 [Tanacetum coccineum]
MNHRLILLQEIEKIDKFASMDIIQKAHVKWDIEGDENSKFFHGLINQKRRNQMINGIMVEGNWITNPCLIKDAFLQFYKRKFQAQESPKYWGTIQKDLYDFVNLFFASCVMPNGANSSFFTLIPKVNNPTLITDFRPISLIASGLKINIHKSNIYGIGVNKDEVLSMASNAGCMAGDIPFNYLGLPIGSNRKETIASWE